MGTVYDRFESADTTSKDRGEGGDHKRYYGVLDETDQGAAELLVRAAAPLAVSAGTEILVRQSVASKPVGLDHWHVDVSYGPEDDKDSEKRPEPGTWKFGFNTTGAKQKVTTMPLVARYGSDSFGDAPDLQGAVNYDGDKKVEGVELPVANGKFWIVQYFEARAVTPALMRTLQRSTPRVNSDVWLGFDPGEVIYEGSEAEGDIPTIAGQKVQPIGVKHHFDSSENLKGITDIEGIDQQGKYGPGAFDSSGNSLNGQPAPSLDKKGWEYLWVWFKKMKDEDFSKVVPRPAFVYVHAPFRRMKFGDFFGFGAGG
jgi:hypothetical protein